MWAKWTWIRYCSLGTAAPAACLLSPSVILLLFFFFFLIQPFVPHFLSLLYWLLRTNLQASSPTRFPSTLFVFPIALFVLFAFCLFHRVALPLLRGRGVYFIRLPCEGGQWIVVLRNSIEYRLSGSPSVFVKAGGVSVVFVFSGFILCAVVFSCSTPQSTKCVFKGGTFF